MKHVIQAGQSTDPFSMSLGQSDIVEFALGQFRNKATLNLKSGCQVTSGAPGRPQVAVDGSHDAVRVPRGVTGTVIKSLGFVINDKLNSACSVSGVGCTINDITQTGPGRVLTMNAAQKLTADMLVSNNNALNQDYAIWGALDGAMPAHGPIDCTIKRFDITMTKGMHGIRCHKHTNLVLGDPSLSLPNLNFAGRITYTSAYDGAALTLKEGANARIIRVQTFGPVGFGPNDAEIPGPHNVHAGNPNWEQLRLEGLTISKCEFHVGKRFFYLMAGCEHVLVQDTVIIPDGNAACIRLGAAHAGPNGGWPAPSGEFRNVIFQGTRLIDDSGKPLLQNFTFTNCMLGTKKLGPHGEVIETTVVVPHPVPPTPVAPTPVVPPHP